MPVLIDKVLRIGEGKQRRRLEAVARQVNAIEDDLVAMSDADLRAQTDEFKARLAAGETLDELLPEAFATVREVAKRVLGQRHFDVQIMGGAALHYGNIAEMKTGEGKTLVSTLPAYLNALAGNGVHVVTVNDYLAKYHAEWMGRIYHFLGLTVGMVLPELPPAERRESYNADVTYGTNNEFGFDYLRDNMASSIEECVQRGHHYAIVDEVDSILIDEARTPLIISGPSDESVKWYGEFAGLVSRLRADIDYEVDEKKRTVAVLEDGIERVEDHLGIDNLYDAVNTPLISFLNNAIKAKELFRKDRDYVVIDGEVLIVDEHTGRILHGRRYNEGLHQAIEAKEAVQIREEYQTLATITLQNYFRLYKKLAGMTGTAMTESSEFDKIYKLGVVAIPTNKPMVRADQPDLVYRTEDAKYAAIVDDIAERHAEGQPMLVGTTSVEKSERLSGLLKRRGVPHTVLNAKEHENEAHIVAQAGRRGAVTVATNMAGRGTDIMLGGSVEFLADEELRRQGLDPVEHSDEYEAAWPSTLERMKKQVQAEHDDVNDLGGLYVVGTERHESRRIDNQLRGRSGRQGDPGESRFYLSLEDDLMRLFKSDWVDWVLQTMKIPDDVPIENKRVTGAIASAQAQVESQNFETRKDILKYDDVMSRQREVIYAERRRVLEGADLHEQIRGMVDDTITGYVTGATEGFPEEWDLAKLWTALKTLYPVSVSEQQLEAEVGGVEALTRDFLLDELLADAHRAYDEREETLGSEVMRELERQVLLSVLDRKWREHLYEMDYLREGIGLRAYSQRDPLVEYQREGFELFSAMMEAIKEESVGFLFNLEVQVADPDPTEGVPLPNETVEPEPGSAVASTSTAEPDTSASRVGATPVPVSEPEPGAAVAEPTASSTSNGAAEPASSNGTREHRPQLVAKGLAQQEKPKKLAYTSPTVDGDATPELLVEDTDEQFGKVARNAPCPCGSGRKYKRCHGDPARRSA